MRRRKWSGRRGARGDARRRPRTLNLQRSTSNVQRNAFRVLLRKPPQRGFDVRGADFVAAGEVFELHGTKTGASEIVGDALHDGRWRDGILASAAQENRRGEKRFLGKPGNR